MSEISAGGHSFGEYYIIENVSCTNDGKKARHCSSCDFTEYEIIAKTGHSPSETVKEKETEETCTGVGYYEAVVYCETCSSQISRTSVYVSPKGHSFGEYTVTNTPACATEGLKERSCSNCGLTESEKIPAIGHTPDIAVKEKVTNATCTGVGYYEAVVYCKTCSSQISRTPVYTAPIGHAFSEEFTVDYEAGCTNAGLRSRHCTVDGCTGKTNIEIVEANGHTYKKETVKATLTEDGSISEVCGVCGEEKSVSAVYRPKTITLSKTAYTYTGKVITPALTVKDSKGKVLKKDTDYTVKYSSGRKATGKYTVTITFKGNYSGKKTLTFYILPKATAKLTLTPSETAIKATWSAVTGASGYKVELYKGSKVIKTFYTSKTAYSLTKLTKATAYKVVVTAYKTIDSKKVYSLSKTAVTSATIATPTLKVTAGKSLANLSWNKVGGASGYVVYMSTSKNGTYSKVATVKSGATVKYTKKSLTKGKTYYFKVKAYRIVDGTYIYSPYSAVKSVKVK